ncbi:ABC transporter ATP-binding protein [Streptomyces sp. NPDC051105]|uniref:ABC transporter ATP-binding protein n=1 Tax=Streptomyces sp. NPDC051105 TaxID=3154843 RepID=UPI0034489818
MSGLSVTKVSKSFGDLDVLRDLDLTVEPGEFAAVIGPSGSGKSTLFNLVSGLDRPTSGQVLVEDEPAGVASGKVAYMPQKDLLFPWRTVLDNTALGLEAQGVRKKVARARADALFADFGLDGFQQAYPSQLSGGMRQRAALLRTVVLERPVLLLDEPFGALDSLTRTEMQLWLAGMWQRHRWTIVLVTHDIRESVLLADTVHVLSPRPATVVDRVEVPLPRPRGADDFTAPEFAATERRILDALRGTTAVTAP